LVAAFSKEPKPPMNAPRTLALLSCFWLSSCFTLGLWGFQPDYDDVDPVTGQPAYAYDEDTEWSWGLLGLRLLLTPVTLALDCVTCPVQGALGLCGDDDDDDCNKHRKHDRHCKHGHR